MFSIIYHFKVTVIRETQDEIIVFIILKKSIIRIISIFVTILGHFSYPKLIDIDIMSFFTFDPEIVIVKKNSELNI